MFGKTWNVRSLRKYKAVFLFFGKGSWHFPNNTNTLVLAFSVLSIEPRALCLLSVGCTTELFLQLLHYWFSTHKLLCQYHFIPSCLQPRSCLPYTLRAYLEYDHCFTRQSLNLFIANYLPSLCSVSHCEDMSGPLLRNVHCSNLLRSNIHDTRSVSDFGYLYRLTSWTSISNPKFKALKVLNEAPERDWGF